MTIREDQPRPMFAAQLSVSRKSFQSLKAAAVWLSEWFAACVNHYAAARAYECLSRLSDAELERRGLSRATLARDLVRMHDRTSDEHRIEGDRARAARPGEAARARAGANSFDRR